MTKFPIDKFEYWVQQIIPQVYDDSLSFYELLNKVVEKLNEVIEKSNEYFSTDLENYVELILTEWKNDGTLGEIINQEIYDNKADLSFVNSELSLIDTQLEEIYDSLNSLEGVFLNLNDYPREGNETDDSGRLSRAFADLANGGKLIIPGQTLTLNKNVNLHMAPERNIYIEGVGRVEILSGLTETANGSNMIGIFGDTTNTLSLENIELKHTSLTIGKINGLYIQGVGFLYMKNVSCIGFSKWGCYIYEAMGGLIQVKQMNQNRYAGLGLERSKNINIIGGEYNQNGNTAVVDGYGITLKTSGAQNVHNENIVIQGITANGNYRKGIDVHNGVNIVIRDNTVIGFGNDGIYAINEGWNGSEDKTVKDVQVIGNYVDGAGSFTGVYGGIEVGAYGATATNSGDFIVSHNIIRNITGIGLVLSNAAASGISPVNMVVTENTLENASGAGYSIIKASSNGRNIGRVKISDNIVHSVSCTIGIDVQQVTTVQIHNNIISVATGTVDYAIFIPSGAYAVVSGNAWIGLATYTQSIPMSGSTYLQMIKNNFNVNRPSRDAVYAGITHEYGDFRPTSGHYYKGSVCYNTDTSILGTAGNQYTLLGWRRITTGSTHTLGSDWVEMRVYTGS